MSPHPFNVLVADDSRDMRDALSEMVTQFVEAHVDEAEDGRQCLDFIAETHYDLLLLDLMMPALDGFEVLKVLKDGTTNRPQYIAAITGRVDLAGNRNTPKIAGADTVLLKPFSLADVKSVVEAATHAQVTDALLDNLMGA